MTLRFTSESANEIDSIAGYFNEFLVYLAHMLTGVENSASSLTGFSHVMKNRIDDSILSTENINRYLDETKDDLNQQEESIGASFNEINQISSHVNNLNASLENQAANVTESSA